MLLSRSHITLSSGKIRQNKRKGEIVEEKKKLDKEKENQTWVKSK